MIACRAAPRTCGFGSARRVVLEGICRGGLRDRLRLVLREGSVELRVVNERDVVVEDVRTAVGAT